MLTNINYQVLWPHVGARLPVDPVVVVVYHSNSTPRGPLNEQFGRKRHDLSTCNYCVRGGSSTERGVDPGK